MLHIKSVVALMDKRSFSVGQRHYAHDQRPMSELYSQRNVNIYESN